MESPSPPPGPTTRLIQHHVARLAGGEAAARDDLLTCGADRLAGVARRMMAGFPKLRRWVEADDVAQGAAVRLHRALADARPPTAADYFRLAAACVRRELIDLARRYYGPRGMGTRHRTNFRPARPGPAADPAPTPDPPADDGADPLAEWADFQRAAEALPADEREAFGLVWYHGMTQAEAAEVLNVSERTVKRWWQAAGERLRAAGVGPPPG